VPAVSLKQQLEACAAELGSAGLSLAIASVVDVDTYDAAGLLLLSSPTFGEGLARAFAYQRLWADGERFVLERHGDEARLRFRHPGSSALARAVFAELAFLETMGAARALADPAAAARGVSFEHAPLGAVDRLAQALGAAPVFRAASSSLTLPGSLLDAPIVVPDGTLAGAHDLLARRAVAELPSSTDVRGRVRAVIKADPAALAWSLPELAGRLRTSARTLQRQLAAEGTSWADLVDEERRRSASALGLRGVSEKEIAFLVGFADPSALARARARWHLKR